MDIKRVLDKNGVLYLWTKIKGLPVSTFTNNAGYITAAEVPEGAKPADTTPNMDGVAASGTSDKYSRADHIHPSDTSKVDVVNGKGLSTYDFDSTYKTKLDNLDTTIQQAIASSSHMTKEIVDELPPIAEAKENVIYMVKVVKEEKVTYDEYTLINGAYEPLGDTDIDMSEYVKHSEIVAITNSEIDEICDPETEGE